MESRMARKMTEMIESLTTIFSRVEEDRNYLE